MSKKKDNGEIQKAPDHLDQIRDIIFGAQKREYEHRFGQLKSDLASFHTGLQKQIDELKDVLVQHPSLFKMLRDHAGGDPCCNLFCGMFTGLEFNG